MNVLMLTSNLGYGHLHAARAIEGALRRQVADLNCHYLDLWSLMDKRVADAVKDGYLRMARDHTVYYQRLYDLDADVWRQLSGLDAIDPEISSFLRQQLRHWFPAEPRWLPVRRAMFDRAMITSLISLLCNRNDRTGHKVVLKSLLLLIRKVLINRMQEQIAHCKPDVIVASQMYPAALLSHLKRRDSFRHIPAVGVITDFGLQSVWVRPTTDSYCVASSQLVSQLQQHGVAASRIYETGIPLAEQFKQPPEQDAARKSLGLDAGKTTLLVTGGQFGIGILPAVRDLLRVRPACQLLVTTGNSEDLQLLKQLEGDYGERLQVFDWVDNMATLISAADIVLGKPGGLSVSEALACGRPFLATCSLGGQERHNVNFLRRHGVGDLVGPDQDVAHMVSQWLAPPHCLQEMQQRALRLGHRNGADRIAQLILAGSQASEPNVEAARE